MNFERLNVYGLLFVIGIIISAWWWSRLTRNTDQDGAPSGHDARLTIIYFAGLFGALVGAKLAFLIAEGWQYRGDWLALLTGRSITGAILGGYASVEVAKWKLKYQTTTGDLFALIVPLSLAMGRVGCIVQGCCMGVACDESAWWVLHDHEGVARWPSQVVEMIFNLVYFVWALAATRFGWQPGNRFHWYLMAYGLFRFGHEFLRERIELVGELSGYHFIALAMFIFGLIRYLQRTQRQKPVATGFSAPSPSGREPG